MVIVSMLEKHGPFGCALHHYQDYSNEVTPPRIIIDYRGLIFLDQATIFFGDLFVPSLQTRDLLDLIRTLAVLSLVQVATTIGRFLTFTYKINKDTSGNVSSVTLFVWLAGDIENITLLRGRFRGVFCLPSSKALETSTVFDCLQGLGFSELEKKEELEYASISTLYPIFGVLPYQTPLSIEVVETVEQLQLIENFCYSEFTHTILKAERHSFSDPFESDVLVKTLFCDSYFPEAGLFLGDDKVYLILDDSFLSSYFAVPPSFSSFCSPPRSFLDPHYGLRPAFSKAFWRKRYLGHKPLIQYVRDQGARGKRSYDLLPACALLDFWLKGSRGSFDFFHA